MEPVQRNLLRTRERWNLNRYPNSRYFTCSSRTREDNGDTVDYKTCAIKLKNHPNKDALIADLQSNRPYNPFSEESKQMVSCSGKGNVSSYVRPLLMCNVLIAWSIGQQGSFTEPVAHAWFWQNLHENWIVIDSTWWQSLISWSKKGVRHGAHHCKSEAQRE